VIVKALRILLGLWLALLTLAPLPLSASAAAARIDVLRRDGSTTSRITDGDTLRLRLTLPDAVGLPLVVDFARPGGPSLASCTIETAQAACETLPFSSLGWYWDAAADPGRARIEARRQDSGDVLAGTVLDASPRPVVMVHGFASSWEAWTTYLGPDGYLAAHGIPGFAVGDGRAPGKLNTGDLAQPTETTNTLLENAAVVGEYIAGVKRLTGAEMVDLVAHSMGGLISRAYIGRVMAERDVAQLIMLGSPMAGTDCANLPAALGLYLPATLELRPSYVRSIFNAQITERRGVAFHALAGVPILEGFQSPCTDVPTDLAVSLSSVTAIPLDAVRLPILHMELNLSTQAFDEFVLPLLQAPDASFVAQPDPSSAIPPAGEVQFSRLFKGHVDSGASTELTIPIDPGLSLASFSLYDTSRSLQVAVTGASGRTIELDSEHNGLVVVDDPEALFYLGYGFQDPKPGLWRVRLTSTASTPPGGADYALAARFAGGAELIATIDPLLPSGGKPVRLAAHLRLGSQDLALHSAVASVQRPDGSIDTLTLEVDGSQIEAEVRAGPAGLYGVDLVVTGSTADGTSVERSAFLAFEVQPDGKEGFLPLVGIGVGVGLALLAAVGVIGIQHRRKRDSRTSR
jgi:pimeloyl-ACP methyl ester carboxylesterase